MTIRASAKPQLRAAPRSHVVALVGNPTIGVHPGNWPDDKLLTRDEAAAFLAVCGCDVKPSYLAWMASQDPERAPPSHKEGGRVFYVVGELRQWLADRLDPSRWPDSKLLTRAEAAKFLLRGGYPPPDAEDPDGSMLDKLELWALPIIDPRGSPRRERRVLIDSFGWAYARDEVVFGTETGPKLRLLAYDGPRYRVDDLRRWLAERIGAR